MSNDASGSADINLNLAEMGEPSFSIDPKSSKAERVSGTKENSKGGNGVNGSGDITLNIGAMGEPSFNMPEAKLGLAKAVLLFLFLLVAFAYITSFVPDEYVTARSIKFAENIYQGIVPVVSMVIGYYFAKD